MSAFFAWLLAFAIKHWHAALDAALAVFVVSVLLFRSPTLVEVLLFVSLVAHHFRGWIEAAVSWLAGQIVMPIPEDD